MTKLSEVIFLFKNRTVGMETTDSETGELMPSIVYPEDKFNAYDLETGEPDSNTITLLLRKTRFSIPKELFMPPANDSKKCCCIDPNETFTLFKKEEVINLQEVCMGCRLCYFQVISMPK